MLDVIRFVGVGDVATIPRYQNIAFMEGCEGEMTGVAVRVIGHHFVGDVLIHQSVDLW